MKIICLMTLVISNKFFKQQINEWRKNSFKVEVKWCYFFEYTKADNIDTINISAL